MAKKARELPSPTQNAGAKENPSFRPKRSEVEKPAFECRPGFKSAEHAEMQGSPLRDGRTAASVEMTDCRDTHKKQTSSLSLGYVMTNLKSFMRKSSSAHPHFRLCPSGIFVYSR